MRFMLRSSCAVIVLGLAAGCQSPAKVIGEATSSAVESYAPGLGELMSLQQMRHVKLWLAGEAGNWKLASYELDELREGFDDIIKFHPTHKDSPVRPKDAIPRMVFGPLDDLGRAVDAQNVAAFRAAYDALTTACNHCHDATNFGFNRVQRPAGNPYPNQVFAAGE